MRIAIRSVLVIAAGLLTSPARALGASCILTLTTPGTIVMTPQGSALTSQASGGASAVITVAAVLTKPMLIFSPPAVLGPTGWSASPITYLAWDTLSGSHQNYTSGASSVQLATLVDTVTINSQVVSTTGFKGGAYTVSTTVTCQQ